MRARDLAVQNFSVAKHLLQLHQLFRELREHPVDEQMRLAVCSCLKVPETTAVRQANNEQVVLLAQAATPIPDALLAPDGTNLLLRQAVVVACTALESFFWDVLRENVLTIVRARKRQADESLRKLILTLDDYMSLEDYSDPDLRLRQIILKNFERETLYDIEKIGKIASTLTVRDFWRQVAERCGMREQDIKSQLNELISRRNQIAHRADRPDESVQPAEPIDGHGLRAIHYAWVNMRVATASNVVEASSDIFQATLDGLERQIEQEREQQLARETLREKE